MKVITKWNIAYKGNLIPGNTVIDMDEMDYPRYINDVIKYDTIKFNLGKKVKIIKKKIVKQDKK